MSRVKPPVGSEYRLLIFTEEYMKLYSDADQYEIPGIGKGWWGWVDPGYNLDTPGTDGVVFFFDAFRYHGRHTANDTPRLFIRTQAVRHVF